MFGNNDLNVPIFAINSDGIKGDLNVDNRINYEDIVLFIGAYQNYWSSGILNREADFDNDQDIDYYDIIAFVEY